MQTLGKHIVVTMFQENLHPGKRRGFPSWQKAAEITVMASSLCSKISTEISLFLPSKLSSVPVVLQNLKTTF